MSLTWLGLAQCNSYPCPKTCTVTFELEAKRKITIKVPEGWVVSTHGLDDSMRDVNEVDVDGDDYRVHCPEHTKENY